MHRELEIESRSYVPGSWPYYERNNGPYWEQSVVAFVRSNPPHRPLVASASLVVTSALQVVTKSY